MEDNWLQVPSNRKPSRMLRLCLLLGLVCLMFLIAMPGIGSSRGTETAPATPQQD